ncbi:major facilitator superfamily domain-containing protein [Microdochium bolleyi]|uniref:Major facilitator superfamily domain-containing protein n=1 Tax=Microdochium bolleyi TaxID=196109 RepID=A0A136J9E3_9PEZI|nr:major facilitator superfamily domain-containing protein [Microdochium bolleyi]
MALLSAIMLAIHKLLKYWEPLRLEGDIGQVRNRQRREARVLQILEGIGFSWRIYFVAFFGFLASSWSLIAINITMPALIYVYDLQDQFGLHLDIATLVGTVLGMIIFGIVADQVGRSALYGFELLIVLAAIGGAAFSSQGYTSPVSNTHHSMDMNAALIWWRFALGLGIGAEYPMSAVIAAEFTSTAWRGTMLAAIFIAQPVGRLLAYGLSMAIIAGYTGRTAEPTDAEMKITADSVWRLVLGLAGAPAVFAVALRFFIPETPRFYSAVKRDHRKAIEVALRLGSASTRSADTESLDSDELDEQLVPNQPRASWRTSAWAYLFGTSQGWKRLFAITLQWLLLDVCFCGTGLDSPSTLAALWLDKAGIEPAHIWNEDPGHPNADIYSVLAANSRRTLLTTSIAALLGSVCAIPLVGFVSRKSLYVITSAVLAMMFAANAIAIHKTYAQPSHVASIVFYALTQFLFNVGPNTLTFVIAVEIFPTEFRGTCYGIAAAGGKVGAIIIRPIVAQMGEKNDKNLPVLLGIFAIIMAIMAILAWIEPFGIGFPLIQQLEKDEQWSRRLNNLSLEEISPWPPSEDEEERQQAEAAAG